MSRIQIRIMRVTLIVICMVGCFVFAIQHIHTVMAQQNNIFTVDSTLDIHDAIAGDGECATIDGVCTLRAAIMESNALEGANVINIPPGTYRLTIVSRLDDTGAFGDLDVTDDLELIGNSAEDTIIDGDNLDRVLHLLNETTTVLIDKVTIQNGNTETEPPGGAGIYNRGTLTIRNSIIRQNRTDPDNLNTRGGGIRHDSGRKNILLIEDSIIEDNLGQGVYTFFGRMSASRVTIRNNEGEGIVHAIGNSRFLLTDSLVIGNTKRGVVGRDVDIADTTIQDNGGGIQISGGSVVRTIIRNNSTVENGGGIVSGAGLTILDSIVEDNHSIGSYGGGIAMHGGRVSGSLFVKNSRIVSNTAVSGGGVYIESQAYINTSSTLPHINNSFISGNLAQQVGGGIYSNGGLYLQNSTVSNNQAAIDGGGILISVLRADNSTISNNQAGKSGGGIYLGLDQTSESTAVLSNLTIFENQASNGTGGLHNELGLVTLGNSIIAGNINQKDGSNDCSTRRPIISEGHNLVQDTTGCTMAGDTDSNIVNIEPMLGPLKDNGGSTHTHALLANSPAIDSGPVVGCTNVTGVAMLKDQRGFLRVVDGNSDGSSLCDVGAYEFGDGIASDIFVPLILVASSSSATLIQQPSGTQLGMTFGILVAGLFLSFVVVLGLSTEFAHEERQVATTEKQNVVSADND